MIVWYLTANSMRSMKRDTMFEIRKNELFFAVSRGLVTFKSLYTSSSVRAVLLVVISEISE